MLVLGIEAAIVERGNVVAKALAVRRDQIVERSDHAFRRVAGDVDLARLVHARRDQDRSEEHTSELQSLMRISYAVFCLKKKIIITNDKIRTYCMNYNLAIIL